MRATPALGSLPRPVILVAFGEDNPYGLDREWVIGLFGALLDLTQGTLVVADPAGNAPKLAHSRVRRVRYDLGPVTSAQTSALVRWAQLVISFDDGVGEPFGAFPTPALRIWRHKAPPQIGSPEPQTLNLVCGQRPDSWISRRWEWNLLESAEERPAVAEVVQLANDILAGPDFGLPGEATMRAVQLKHYLRRCRQRTPFAEYADRHLTFDRLFREIGKRFSDPIIVETGCVRAFEDWSAGYSSYLFGTYLTARQAGHLHSVDCSSENLRRAQAILTPFVARSTLHESDSVRWLENYSGRIDVLYLDSMDVGVAGYEEHALAEARAAFSKLHSDSLVLLDDTVWDEGWSGKGAKVVPWLTQQGWRILLAGYQVLLTR